MGCHSRVYVIGQKTAVAPIPRIEAGDGFRIRSLWERQSVDHLCGAILCCLVDLSVPDRALDADVGLAELADAWLREHLASCGRLKSAASSLGVEYNRLRRVYRRIRGRSLLEALTDFRMQSARDLLGGTDLRLDEIARRCGYGNAAYLTEVFKKITGQPPGAWRVQNRALSRRDDL